MENHGTQFGSWFLSGLPDLLLSKCIPTGWLNPTGYFSWKRVALARGKTPHLTRPPFKGRCPFPAPNIPFTLYPRQRTNVACLLGAEVGTDEPASLLSEAWGLPLTQATMGWGFYLLTFIKLWDLGLTYGQRWAYLLIFFRSRTKRKCLLNASLSHPWWGQVTRVAMQENGVCQG